jgi:hypothetical protein
MFFQIIGYKQGALGGHYQKAEYYLLTLKRFTKLEYQKKLERYLKQETGFADVFIRFSNQLRFSLLSSSSVYNVIVGKNNYLYTNSYIYSYYGIDYQGEENINLVVDKLAQIRDTLKVKGVDLVFLMAPGKGTCYPEYFPYRYARLKPKTTNYQTYIKAFNKYNIDCLDFNSWLCSARDTASYRLYSNTSVHWGKYACYLAVDSLIKYLDLKYSIDLPKIRLKSITESNIMYDSDDDVEKMMNVLENIPDEPMPKIDIDFDTLNKDKLRVLTIGDSYFFGLNDFGLLKTIFYKSEFWYYFDEVRRSEYEYILVSEYEDIKKEIEKNKLLLIIFTEANLHTTPKENIEELYYIYCAKPTYKLELERHKERFKNQIKKDKNWLKFVQEKADKKDISIDKAIDEDAEYMAKEYLKDKF